MSATFLDAILLFSGKKLPPDRREEAGQNSVSFTWEGLCSAVVELSPSGDCQATWRAETNGDFAFVLSFRLPGDGLRSFFVPGVWYDGNLSGKGLFPRKKLSDTWLFMETRMSVPGFVHCRGEKEGLLLAVAPARTREELCSTGFSPEALYLMVPGREHPFSYRGKTSLQDTAAEPLGTIGLRKGMTYSRRFVLRRTGAELGLEVFRRVARSIQNSAPPSSSSDDWELYKETKLARLLNMTRRSPDGGAFVVMGEGNGENQSVYEFTSASFLVKSLEAAVCFHDCARWASLKESPALRGAMERIGALFGGGVGLERLAVLIGRHFLSCEVASGVFADNIDIRTGEKGGYLGIGEHPEYRSGVNARTNGEAMGQYVRLYQRTGLREFLDLPLRVAGFYMAHQLEDGSYGRWYSQEGEVLDSFGTNGAYMASLMLDLLPYDKDGKLGRSVDKALSWYADLSLRGGFYGDTLDADCCDKEAGIALAELFLKAFEHGKGSQKIAMALDKAASFILTWIWQENSFIDPLSPLGRLGFKTKGMSSVSVAHHHLDFYGMKIALLFLRLWRLNGDGFWKTEARMAAEACLQLVEDGSGRLGRDMSFYGWQPEQMNHTGWDYFSRSERANGGYDIDIAWVHALGLGAWLEIERSFPGAICPEPQEP